MKRIIKRVTAVSKHPVSSLVLKIADIAARAGISAGSGPIAGSTLYEFAAVGAKKLRSYVYETNDRRLFEFHKNILIRDEELDEAILAGELDEATYHALLQACLSDIEDEKTVPYANLTRAIVLGQITKQLRRHYIISLKEISWDQLDILRNIYVVETFSVADATGALVPSIAILMKDSSDSIQSIAYNALYSKGFLDDGGITGLGREFVRSCSLDEDLNPAVYGYPSWSMNRCLIILLDNGNRGNNEIIRQLEIHLEDVAIKLAPTVSTKFVFAQQPDPSTNCCFVISRQGVDIGDEMTKKLTELIKNKCTVQIFLDDHTPSIPNKPTLNVPFVTTSMSDIPSKTKDAVSKVLELLKTQ